MSEKSDPSFVVKEECVLLHFLIDQMPHKNRDNIKTFLRDQQVLVDDQPVTLFNYPLKPGQVVRITRNKIVNKGKSYRGITIVYEDNDLIVIDKHAGVLSVSTEGKESFTAYSLLYSHVKNNNPEGKIFVVHRLDRDTSGLLVFAKSAQVQKKLQKSWNELVLERGYIALVEGVVDPPEGEISSYLRENKNRLVYSSDEPGDGKWAVTKYRTIKTNEVYSLLQMTLRTGRKNQIRVHLSDIGHPVTGDKKYGSQVIPIGRMGLHARTLSFIHPVNGRVLNFTTAVPRKFYLVFK